MSSGSRWDALNPMERRRKTNDNDDVVGKRRTIHHQRPKQRDYHKNNSSNSMRQQPINTTTTTAANLKRLSWRSSNSSCSNNNISATTTSTMKGRTTNTNNNNRTGNNAVNRENKNHNEGNQKHHHHQQQQQWDKLTKELRDWNSNQQKTQAATAAHQSPKATTTATTGDRGGEDETTQQEEVLRLIVQSFSTLLEKNSIIREQPQEQPSSNYHHHHHHRDSSSIGGKQLGCAVAEMFSALPFVNNNQDTVLLQNILECSCSMFSSSPSLPPSLKSLNDHNNSNSHHHHHHQEEEEEQESIQMTTIQAQKSLEGLMCVKNKLPSFVVDMGGKHNIITTTTDMHLLKCWMHLLICCSSELPAEITAHEVVGKILLPALENSLQHILLLERSSSTTTTTTTSVGAAGGGEGNYSKNYEIASLGIQALQSLLLVKKQSSALLAPLVNDVSSEGQEVYLVNQLRKQIFRILQNGIRINNIPEVTTTSAAKERVNSSSCCCWILAQRTYQCLETALIQAAEVDRITSSSSPSTPRRSQGAASAASFRQGHDLDLAVMESFFREKLQQPRNDGRCSSSSSPSTNNNCNPEKQQRQWVLRLLLAFLKKQPQASASMGSVLLFTETAGMTRDTRIGGQSLKPEEGCSVNSSMSGRCPGGVQPPLSFFLADLYTSKNAEEMDMRMDALAILLANIPWNLWLGKTSFPQATNRHTTSTSNFLQRVSDAIKSIVFVSKFLLVSCWKKKKCIGQPLSNSIVSLIRATLLLIPYGSLAAESIQEQDLVIAAADLFGTLAQELAQKDHMQHPLLGQFADVLEECLGGKVTPKGTKTVMVVPARTWLSSVQSQVFLDSLLHELHKASSANAMHPISKISLRLLRSILRVHPQTVLVNEEYWNTFQAVIQSFSNSNNAALVLSGFQLLEGFVHGRRHVAAPVSEECRQGEVVEFILKLLPPALKQVPGPSRCLCVQVYGSLCGSDWFMQQSPSDMKDHIDIILLHCLATEPVAGVRSASCKAIGDFCSVCFLPSEQSDQLTPSELQQRQEGLKLVGQDICVALLQARDDRNAAVRGMAVFALGNLAQVISCSCIPGILNAATLRDACMAGFDCIDDENDKVCGNGIRSLGHLGSLVLREDYMIPLRQVGWNVDSFCQKSVYSLSQKVDAISGLMGEGTPKLSWKQRSRAKKHGRVACNTLVILLKKWSVSDSSLDSIHTALSSVVKCLEFLGTSLDEKALIAAMLVLQALPSSSLARVSGKRCLVGNALVTSISFIAKERWSGPMHSSAGTKLLEQVELLCEHLLDSVSIADASIVFTSMEDILETWMDDLFEWMVARNCKAHTFDAFAIAFQKPAIRVPVTVEHKFANRAMNLLRSNGEVEPDSDDEL